MVVIAGSYHGFITHSDFQIDCNAQTDPASMNVENEQSESIECNECKQVFLEITHKALVKCW